jgi:predicted amidohydrolase YtcJ
MSLLVLHNGKIVTMDANNSIVEAIVIDTQTHNVVATGSDRDILARYNNAKQTLNLHGKTVVPGLNDSHLHFIREGNHFNLELRWDGIKSLSQGLDMIRHQASRTPSGQWIRVVGGWCERQLKEQRLPTLDELNEAAGEHPVFVLHLYDCALVNKVGMKLLGYNRDTPNPPASEIVRDANGEPTGMLVARPNAFLLYNTLDKLPKLSHEDKVNSTLAYARECNRFGLTSCLDPGGGFQSYPTDYAAVQQVDDAGQLNVRVSYSLFPQRPKHELEDFQRWIQDVKQGQGSAYLKHLGAGEMLAFSAADFEDFKEPRPDLPSDMESDLKPIVRLLASAKWPFRLHATYGESIERELAVFEALEKETPGSISGLRWFIDHAETVTERDIARIKALNGGIAIQDRMRYQGDYFVDRYGAEAAATSPPFMTMLQHQVPLGCGTDGTRVSSYNPWESVAWLINGQTVSGLELYPPTHRLSRMDALRLWTVANAWFTNEEAVKGSLEVGKLADLAVLNQDYLTIDDKQIETIESLVTIVGGKVVYVNPASAHEFGLQADLLKPVTPAWSPVNVFGGYQLNGSKAWPNVSSADDVKSWSAANDKSESVIGKAVRSVEAFFGHEHGHVHGHSC